MLESLILGRGEIVQKGNKAAEQLRRKVCIAGSGLPTLERDIQRSAKRRREKQQRDSTLKCNPDGVIPSCESRQLGFCTTYLIGLYPCEILHLET